MRRARRRAFCRVGTALACIRDERLYRDTHATFDDDCRERWGWTRQWAHQVIDAASVSSMLDTPPANARQAAALAPLARADPDAARAVVSMLSIDNTPPDKEAQARAQHGDDLTARDVRESERRVRG
jgi:hypothetical protein